MTRSQIQQSVVILLMVAFGGVWLMTRMMSFTQQERAPSSDGTGVASVGPPDRKLEEALPVSSIQTVQMSRIKRDPFRLPPLLLTTIRKREAVTIQRRQKKTPPGIVESVPTQPPELTVQGVFWGTAHPQVLINRKLLSVGDEIDGTKILAVTKQGVTISHQGQKFNLKLPQTIHGEDRR